MTTPNQNSNCPQLRTALNHLTALHADYLRAYNLCESQKDFSPLQPNKDEIKKQIEALKISILNYEPSYDLELRSQIAQKLGAKFVSAFHNGVAYIEMPDTKEGFGKSFYVDKAGGKVILKGEMESGVDKAFNFHHGVALVCHEHNYFLIDKSGNNILKGALADGVDDATDFCEGIARVKLGNVWFLIDKNGNSILKDEMSDGVKEVKDFHEGVARVKTDLSWYFIDKRGKKVVLKGEMAEGVSGLSNFHEGYAKVIFGGKSHFIDKSGKKINLKEQTEQVTSESQVTQEGAIFSFDSKKRKHFLIDKEGNRITIKGVPDGGVDWNGDFHEGIVKVGIGEKEFYVDKRGNKVVLKGEMANGVDAAFDFHNGTAIVRINNNFFCYIDKEGNKVVLKDEMADGVNEAENFHEGLAHINFNSKWFYIDKNGNKVF